MAFFDVFNGDADGICALTQLRLAEPRQAELITGVKRDIALTSRVQAKAGDQVTILDISFEKNLAGVSALLEAGAECFYVDHHFPGDIPEHENLQTLINTAPDTCTSILVNGHLKGAFIEWAIVGAFGDNLKQSATALAASIQLSADKVEAYQELGILLNYNGYGSAVEDLHFAPDELFRRVSVHRSPADFISDDSDSFSTLRDGYRQDMSSAQALEPCSETAVSCAYLLPDAAWSRRVSGVFGNDLANQSPDKAHAVITERADGTYLISVRAPLNNKTGADEICRQFATGGGRKAAAGINALPKEELERFLALLNDFYSK